MGTPQLSAATMRRLQPGLDAIPPIDRRVEEETLVETRRFRGITRDVAARYLENLGGERIDLHTVAGEEWRCELSTRKVPVGPSYRLTEVEITWTGNRDVLEPIIYEFRIKAFRAPG